MTRALPHWSVLSIVWAAAALVVAFGSFDPAVRVLVVLPFILLIPGLALVRLFELADDTLEQATTALAISVALVVLVPLAMLSLDRWSPDVGLLVLVAITIIAAGSKVVSSSGVLQRRPSEERTLAADAELSISGNDEREALRESLEAIRDAERRLALLIVYAAQAATGARPATPAPIADKAGAVPRPEPVAEESEPRAVITPQPPSAVDDRTDDPSDTLDEVKPALSVVSSAVETCRIEWWRGYVKSEFYARVTRGDGTQYIAGRSPTFRWRHSTPPPATDRAVVAYEALVDQLVAHGWQPEPHGDESSDAWWEHSFRRTG